MESWGLLSDIVLLLAGALVLGGIFSRLGQSPLVGYLLAGMILGGPGSVRAVKSETEIEAIAELGVALLLFSLGLEFSIARLKKLGSRKLISGALQVALTMTACSLAAGLYGLGTREAIAVGAMVSLSSTAVVLRILMERRELESPIGSNSLAVLLVQDMAVVPLAIVIALLAGGTGPGAVALNVGKVVAAASALVLVLYVVLNHIATRALHSLTLERNRELTILLAVVTGLGSSWAAHWAGVSPALGAFVAGMFLGSSPFATQVRADISSLRVVLLTLFFGSAGMLADPIWILRHVGQVVAVVAVIGAIKLAVVWGIFRAMGQPGAIAAASGAALAQVGEFAFVLGSVARSAGVIADDTHMLIISVTIVTLFVSPFVVPRAPRIGAWLAKRAPDGGAKGTDEPTTTQSRPDVVIIGFGPAGQIAAQAFTETALRAVVIDLNREGVRAAQKQGFEGHVGDASQFEVLEHAHVAGATLVVVTVPHPRTAAAIVDNVSKLAPQAHVVVRSRYERDAQELAAAGADYVIGDEAEIGSRMAEHLRRWLGAREQESGT